MDSLVEAMIDEKTRPTTKWVKGELHDVLAAGIVDPRGLIAEDAALTPFDQIDWFTRVAQHWQGEFKPLIAHAWHEGRHCWLFLAQRGASHAVSLSSWYSFAFRPVFAGGKNFALIEAIAKRLRESRSVPPILTLAPVPRADGTSELITQAFRKSGWIANRSQSSTSWTADVAGMNFDTYWAARPGQLRSTFQRKAKKSTIAAEILTRFSEKAWSDYESVYGDSWKPEEGAAAFLREMAQYESDAGRMRLGLATLDGQVIAAQFWVVSGGIAYIHKLAHREEHKDLSPGTILSHALFRHVIDVDNVDVIDFGTGNDRYKADWMDLSDVLDTIRLYKKSSPTALIAAARERISALVRRKPLD